MSGKRKSKMAARLAMWEQASNTGIDSVPKKPGSAKKNRKRVSVSGKKSKLANMWEDKTKESKDSGIKDMKHKPPIKHSPVSKLPKYKTTTTTPKTKPKATETETTATVRPKVTPKTTPIPSTESKQDEIPKKKVKRVSKLSGRAAMINLAGLRGGPPPSLAKKKKVEANKPKEMINEEFPRITMTVDRKSRTKPEANAVLDSTDNKTESDTEMANNDDASVNNGENTKDTEITNNNMETIIANLTNFMKNEFIFDECMLMPSKYLLLYLKEKGEIDLSGGARGRGDTISSVVSPIATPTTTNEDDTSTIASLSPGNDRLKECILNLFGIESVKPFGYAIRLLTDNEKNSKENKNNERMKINEMETSDNDNSDDSNVQNNSDREMRQKKLYETV